MLHRQYTCSRFHRLISFVSTTTILRIMDTASVIPVAPVAPAEAAVTATAIPAIPAVTTPPLSFDIDAYKTKFEKYPDDLVEFAAAHTISLMPLKSMRGQALALMAQPEIRGKQLLSRTDTVKFFQNIGMETSDAIQQFNKATGLKRVDKKGVYCLRYPFEFDKTDLEKRKGAAISGDRNTCIEAVKTWWRENLVDVPNEQWQVGHLDPTIPDASEQNLAYQPPIQGKYRNRFKWDEMFHKMWPTGDELAANMDRYHTEDEQRKMFEALKKKFDK